MFYYIVLYIEHEWIGNEENTESLTFALIHSTFHSHHFKLDKLFHSRS